jgi:hypothetical protein
VRRVGDELAPRTVRALQAQPHLVERQGQPGDLVLAAVAHRLLEVARGDAA